MRTDQQLMLMAITFRGLCASRCKTMSFLDCEDTFADRWEELDPAIRNQWTRLSMILDTLYAGDIYKQEAN